ncbi:MAG: hypothetical protein AB7Q29_16695 [Vicinamibacterales bacterium]
MTSTEESTSKGASHLRRAHAPRAALVRRSRALPPLAHDLARWSFDILRRCSLDLLWCSLDIGAS